MAYGHPDLITDWAKQGIIADHRSEESVSALYRSWRAWADRERIYALSLSAFSRALSLGGYQKKRTNHGVFYVGVRLKDTTRNQRSST